MNVAAATPAWLLAIVLLLLVAATVEDVVRRRISNIISVSVVACAVAAMAYAGFPVELWQNVLVFVLILAAGTALFAAGMMGGGDVKLFAALGLWVSLTGALWLVASIFLMGGLLALLFVGTRLVAGRGLRDGKDAPYGIAIAAGALLTFALQANW